MAILHIDSRLFFFLIITLMLVLMPPQPSQAVSILVDTAVDDDTSNGNCSLREAITAANTGSAIDGCSAGSLIDTITFADNYTITLDSQLPQITSNIIITGNGAANTIIQASSCNPVTLSGGCTPATYGVLDVADGIFAFLTINNLTIANGNTTEGGGIDNAGRLVVSNAIFSSNFATNQGGGIRNNVTGSLTVSNTTFSANRANFGGGIFNNNGTITSIANTTFSGNSAIFQGGGFNNAGPVNEITNCTFSENSASIGGGIYNFVGRPITKITNTIIAKSLSGGNCSGPAPITSINNLTDSGGCSSWDSTNWPTTLDPDDLGSLISNGGPTLTHALLGTAATNPAIDTGDASTCAIKDQRGVTRPTTCDIGAYEHILSLTVTKSEDTADGTCDSDCSLREAISIAGGGLTITFAGNSSITLGSPLPQITSEFTITGNGAANTIIQASSCNPVTLPGGCTPATYGVLDVADGIFAFLTINNLTIANGNTTEGGGIDNAGRLVVSNAIFSSNFATNQGGGIRNNVTGSLTVSNTTFSANRANFGGGIFNNNGTITSIANTTFSGNSAIFQGGGFNNAGPVNEITNCTFSENSASIGGGIYNFVGRPITKITNTIIAKSLSGGNCSGPAPITSINNLTDSGGCSSWDSTNWPTTLDPADLGPLISNGGPTLTHALLGTAATNPAINTGDTSTCLNPPVSGKDQRGVTRPQGSDCDIGAFEYVSFPWPMFLPAISNSVE
jgi:CSLREA domain-containing protein